MSMLANLETGIVNKFQIGPALAAPWDDMFKEEGSKFKLQFRSRATVRNKLLTTRASHALWKFLA
jgi:hypothetical protein